MELQARVHEGIERRHDHLRPEVAAADADVDDVADAAGGAVAHRLGPGQHRIEHAVDLVAERSLASRRTQRGVQHRAVFGGVDRRTGKHRVALRFEAAFARQVDQKAQRRDVEVVLRQVGKHLGRVEAERREAARVAGECLTQIEVATMRLEMTLQRGPGGGSVTTRHVFVNRQSARINASSLAASAAKARMPSASFSVAIASSLSA